jgi:Calcineurin-like phosphoesterase
VTGPPAANEPRRNGAQSASQPAHGHLSGLLLRHIDAHPHWVAPTPLLLTRAPRRGAAEVIAGALAAALALVPTSGAWVTISQPELEASYERLWAVSDIHGHREEAERLLVSAGLATRDPGGEAHWDFRARRQLLIVAGDLIDGGPDSYGVVRLMYRLAEEAPGAQSRVVVLLGNHEARSLLSVWPAPWKRLLRAAPVVAFVGPWLFAHAGYIDAGPGEASLKGWIDDVARRWQSGGREQYAQFLTGHSIVDDHDWWKSRRKRKAMRKHLQLLGLDAVVFGHDPSALGARKSIAIDTKGFFLKLDTGMKDHGSAGMLLRCEVPEALRQGLSACRALLPDGAVHDLVVAPRKGRD